MGWDTLYGQDTEPTFVQIADFIQTPLWVELNSYLQNTYQVKPKIMYSKCSMQKAWNVKYQKSGRALCTLYPMSGYFIALVVVGARETHQTELLLPAFGQYTRELYEKTAFSVGGKWLMLHVTDEERLEDLKRLISIRVPPKSAAPDRESLRAPSP